MGRRRERFLHLLLVQSVDGYNVRKRKHHLGFLIGHKDQGLGAFSSTFPCTFAGNLARSEQPKLKEVSIWNTGVTDSSLAQYIIT